MTQVMRKWEYCETTFQYQKGLRIWVQKPCAGGSASEVTGELVVQKFFKVGIGGGGEAYDGRVLVVVLFVY